MAILASFLGDMAIFGGKNGDMAIFEFWLAIWRYWNFRLKKWRYGDIGVLGDVRYSLIHGFYIIFHICEHLYSLLWFYCEVLSVQSNIHHKRINCVANVSVEHIDLRHSMGHGHLGSEPCEPLYIFNLRLCDEKLVEVVMRVIRYGKEIIC